jgi:hypothetical protein
VHKLQKHIIISLISLLFLGAGMSGYAQTWPYQTFDKDAAFTVYPQPTVRANVATINYYNPPLTQQNDSIVLRFTGYPPFTLTFNPNYFNLPDIYETGTPMLGGYPISYVENNDNCIPVWEAVVPPDLNYYHNNFEADPEGEVEVVHHAHIGIENLQDNHCVDYDPYVGIIVICHFEDEPQPEECIPFPYYVVTKWDNTFILNNSRLAQNHYGGYLYCTWYENGNVLDTGQFYTAGNLESHKFTPGNIYRFSLTYPDRSVIYSCDYTFQYEAPYSVLLYPNPVKQNSEIVLDLGTTPKGNETVDVSIYTALGQEILNFSTSSRLNNIKMEVPAAGYIMKVKSSINGETSKAFVVIR